MTSETRGTLDQGCRRREGETGHQAPLRGNASTTPKVESVFTKLKWIAEKASEDPSMKFKNLAHLLSLEYLDHCCSQLNKKSAPGIDEVDAESYALKRRENLTDLHRRLKGRCYKAPPVKRVYIEKDGGGERPLGLPTFEDKIVQRGVTNILESIYEQDFHNFSYGFRKCRNQHQALGAFRDGCMKQHVSWVVDMDIKAFFDTMDHKQLMKFLEIRIGDPRLLQLIGKWLKAGVLEDEQLRCSDEGTPQGGVVSPILANVYLHYVFDEWFEKEIRKVLLGNATVVRFADDALIGFQNESDANRFMKVLPKRFAKYGLELHPKKTKLVKFKRPSSHRRGEAKNGTFNFLGFTHFWAKTLSGSWTIKRKTASVKLRSKMSAIWQWCKDHRHWNIEEQYGILKSKLRGHYQYYGVRCNMRCLEKYLQYVRYCWKHWLGRRHRNGHIEWEEFQNKYEKPMPLPFPKIVHSI